MPATKTAAQYARLFVRRTVKGLFLVLWILVLLFLAAAAASNQASTLISGLIDLRLDPYRYLYMDSYIDSGVIYTPVEYLDNYSFGKENFPPLDAVLNELDGELAWSDTDLAGTAPMVPSDDEYRYARWYANQFHSLFKAAERQLYRIARDPQINPADAKIDNNGFPQVFKELNSDGSAYVHIERPLPPAAVAWVRVERARLVRERERVELIDTFLLLVVLGAFGSLIFLTRDYIEFEQSTRIASYIFRPVLGMFLAMAMFIVTVLGHAVLSTADILEIRHETLYGLALAAGLLSEQAYELVNERAKAALQKAREKTRRRTRTSK